MPCWHGWNGSFLRAMPTEQRAGPRRLRATPQWRLFIAYWPDPALSQHLAQVAAHLQAVTGGRCVPAPQLHLTAAFLGETPADRVPQLVDVLRAQPAIEMDWALDRCGWFRRSQVVWVGSAQAPAMLQAANERLRADLQHIGQTFDAQPFVPHITLLRKARRAPAEAFLTVPLSWQVPEPVLIQSTLLTAGVRYRRLFPA